MQDISKKTKFLKDENSRLLDEFNSSLLFDKQLYKQDIKGSIVHSKMLFLQNIITKEDQNSIEKGLLKIEDEIDNDIFVFNIKDEDIHMAIESRLIDIIGDVAKKLHTARSRNDQVCTDFSLYIQDKNKTIMNKLKTIIKSFLDISSKHTTTLLPGMTHLQHAQPINFAYHMLAYANMFKRDYERFDSSFNRNNLCVLGSAALSGTSHNIDRFYTASNLGFDNPTQNALDSVSNRDFALEILFNISMVMMHISRLSEELILWSSYEFGFISISNEYSTTSSIMPQKKNPDVPELLRGKTGRVYGNLMSLLTVMKGLPLAYNKDTQEDKEGVFDSVKTIEISLDILNEVIKTMSINKENMQKACQVGHLSATNLADYLVQKSNIPFRTAYYITKDVVNIANNLNKDVSQLTIDEIRACNKELSNINEEILDILNLDNSMNSKDSYGGTSTKQTLLQIDEFNNWINSL